MHRLGFLASHLGSNMQVDIDASADGEIRAEPVVLISNNRSARALKRADAAGFPGYCLNANTHPETDQLDGAIQKVLRDHQVDLVILAGYLKKVGPITLSAFRNRMINIHPSLLPRHGGPGMYGLRVHETVLAAGDKVTGVTIHYVGMEYDQGRVIAQEIVSVIPGDSPETLSDRVLSVENELLVKTINNISLTG